MASSQKAFIETIRKEKFSIGADRPNPLAESLHQAIKCLSAELYQKDIHFISELIQNAEDNSYAAGVEPQLDMLLTADDITGVGAPATLILCNNERGFEERHIAALCSIGQSTKKGQRNEGYIGEKGIGFKSVFLVTSTPYIISNGFRIRFSDSGVESNGSMAEIGYIVPEWVERPTDETLRPYSHQFGCRPSTVIVLPLKPDKISSVKAELKSFSAETILFLRRITCIRIRHMDGELVTMRRSDSSRKKVEKPAADMFWTQLSLVRSPGNTKESCDYFVWEQRFPVTSSVDQRLEVTSWALTLAFPAQQRIACSSHGDIFAFLPSQVRSGLPFVINADFLLVSSRETLRYDSPWNKGILGCVATAFCAAMECLLRESASASGTGNSRTIAVHQVYKFVPVDKCPIPQLEEVRSSIVSRLQRMEIVLAAANVGSNFVKGSFFHPSKCRQISSTLREILVKASLDETISKCVSRSSWVAVDALVQSNHKEQLRQLQVPQLSDQELLEILDDSNWLLRISEQLYLEVLDIVSSLTDRVGLDRTRYLTIVKYEGERGAVGLFSLRQITEENIIMYMSPPDCGDYLSPWMLKFNPYIKYRFMPQQLVKAMKEARNKAGVAWLKDVAKVQEIDVKAFAKGLVDRSNSTPPMPHEKEYILLVWEFIYSSIQAGVLNKASVPPPSGSRGFAIVDESGLVKRNYTREDYNYDLRKSMVLLPASCSEWPLLLSDRAWPSDPRSRIRMSEEYINVCLAYSENRSRDLVVLKTFFSDTFGARDLPYLPLVDEPFPGLEDLSSAQSLLLFRWLENHLGSFDSCNKFWSSFMTTAWVHTDEHGLQLPKNCLMPHVDLLRLLDRSEVPYVSVSFYGDVNPFSRVLCKLGVLKEPESACTAVFKQIRRLIKECSAGLRSVDRSLVEKYYHILNGFCWKPTTSQFRKMKIYIPAGGVASDGPASWRSPEDCILVDKNQLFKGVLPSLGEIYSSKLLLFFEKTLGVPRNVHFSRYYDLWIRWYEDGMHYSVGNCAKLWEKIATCWKMCDATVKEKFKVKAMILTATGKELQYTTPAAAFIPDDLTRRKLFMVHTNTPAFVWYPAGSSAYEAELNDVYTFLGVRRLSECIKTDVEMDPGKLCICKLTKDPMFVTSGLLVAILGFISRTKYGLSSRGRQAVLQPLLETVEKEIFYTFPISYTIRSDVSSATTTVEQQLLGFWDQSVLYRVQDRELLADATVRREMQTQVLETMCSKILPDSPSIACSLVNFLKTLVECRFDEAAVEHELQRKNLKLYNEDFEFLRDGPNASLRPQSEGFRSLILM
ncbi:hypothetical protein MPTK1_2g03300 [Marchantia polymorpha subsp. ruderalis]|uniref:Sacsin/Nov domain-containing protein n=2 Tax=Marchantia polymorpha TaxID=3197 RepID=A0A176VUX3_MARPO|nr:hypothetical protein AXG93_2752s1060 [Marchantia polymorpha subsp. ruderalis]PTQ27258.1 hypothetical protein MARPO_0211s0017 [Marchantia polymorpha]BBN00946.1 hypothetical protein Mp_2g03300 [Marchantia polymorpha subsp. ruderalis]|eukprot:PTQ27258.1 hypothetical protein MARPO_0211s0017 [Marchantia polymorpha]